jgi:hypothetical protein
VGHIEISKQAWLSNILDGCGCSSNSVLGLSFDNALIVGRGLPGNGWDGFGAAVIFFFSLPALVLDIIFVFNWPKNTQTRNDSA